MLEDIWSVIIWSVVPAARLEKTRSVFHTVLGVGGIHFSEFVLGLERREGSTLLQSPI